MAQLVKNPPAMQENFYPWVGKDPLEKGKATTSSILAWRIPWIVHGVATSQTRLSDFHFWRMSSLACLECLVGIRQVEKMGVREREWIQISKKNTSSEKKWMRNFPGGYSGSLLPTQGSQV